MVYLHPSQLEDSALWNSFRDGDDNALVIIFDRYAQPLYNYGRKVFTDKETVRDCIQDLFLEICKNRSGLGPTDSIKFYLFKSLRRKLVRIKMKVPISGLEETDKVTPSPEAEIIEKQHAEQRQIILDNRLSRLTNRQREAIFLRYFEELSYEKIAQVMELNRQSIYNLINESMAILKQ